MRKTSLDTGRPKLFSPSSYGAMRESRGSVSSIMSQPSGSSRPGGSGSFRFDSPGSGLKSTQQIPLDWSDFSTHTFFGSAQVNVNVAFDKIVNGFPYDSSREEIDGFIDGLTGFEKWVL